MFEVLGFILLGAFLGIITGLVPGLHVNSLVIILLGVSGALLNFLEPLTLVALVVSTALVHSFMDFIPSVLLGAPQEDNVLSVLPGHRLLLEGRGYEAVRLTVLGGLGAIVISLLLIPILIISIPTIYGYLTEIIALIIFAVIFYMVSIEKGMKRKLYSVLVIVYSGILGIIILNGTILSPDKAIFPALTGLFALSAIIVSLGAKVKLPPQELEFNRGLYFKGQLGGSLGGVVTGLLPSIGASQSALVVQQFMKEKEDPRSFMVALGGVNTSDAIFAILALFLIGNPRSGASVGIEKIIGELHKEEFFFIIAVFMFSTAFAVTSTLFAARVIIRRLESFNYITISLAVFIFLILMIYIFSGPAGLLIGITATAIGLIPPFTGIKRTHGMGVLMVPTIFYFI